MLPRLREPTYHAMLERQLMAQVDDEEERAPLAVQLPRKRRPPIRGLDLTIRGAISIAPGSC